MRRLALALPIVTACATAPTQAEPAPEPEATGKSDQDAWHRVNSEGELWGREVMIALNSLDPEGEVVGTVKFHVKFCKDGSVGKVYDKGGTASEDARKAVFEAVAKIEVSPIPKEHAASMKEECQTLPHVFTFKDGDAR